MKPLNFSIFRKEIPKGSFKPSTKENISSGFKTDEYAIDTSFENILYKSVDKLLVDCYRGKNLKDLMFLSLFSEPHELYNYMLSFYDQQEKDDLYILLMLKAGNIENLVKENKDYIYKNFFSLIYLLLENIQKFGEENLKYLLNLLLSEESKYVNKI
jgi:hypothetical protein